MVFAGEDPSKHDCISMTALSLPEDRTLSSMLEQNGARFGSRAALLSQGQIPAFVELVVHPEDVDAFWEIDPTNTELYEFIEDATRQSGESSGNSRGPGRSSRRTPRR